MEELPFIQESADPDSNRENDLFGQTGWERVRFVLEDVREDDPED